MTPAAVVLIPDRESRPTALGIVRCLGRAGLPVIAVSPRRNTPSLFSRHVTRRVIVPSLEQDPEAWTSGLIAFARSLVDKPVLYPLSDEQVWAIHQHRDELARYFRYAFLSDDTLLSCIDKREMYRMCKTAGIETGQVLSVPKDGAFQDVVDQVVFPSVLKPAAWVHLSEGRSPRLREFQQEFKQKAVAVTTPAELHGALARAARLSVPVMLQELIPGPASAIYHVSLYADLASNVRGVFVARKQRQYPSQFGNACMIETVVGPEIAALAASVIKALRFHGIAGALEFKRHARTGRLHFIEINPRAASSIAAANASGANLPYMAYLDAIGAELPGMTVGETSVRWIDARRDVLYWLSYRKSDHTGQALPLREYLESLRGRREYRYWAPDDPMPAVAQAASLPRDIWLAFKN